MATTNHEAVMQCATTALVGAVVTPSPVPLFPFYFQKAFLTQPAARLALYEVFALVLPTH